MQNIEEGSQNGDNVSTVPPAIIDPAASSPLPTDPAKVTPSTGAQTFQHPSETFLQPDIARSVDYRKEYYKYAIGISTALLAFTMSFQPTLRVMPEYTWLEVVGWIGLGVSTAAGLRVHWVWSKFFSTFQKFDNKGKISEGDIERGKWTSERRLLEKVLIISLIVGVAGVIGFTAFNLKNVALKTDEKAAVEKEQPQSSTTSPTPSNLGSSPAQHNTIPENPR